MSVCAGLSMWIRSKINKKRRLDCIVCHLCTYMLKSHTSAIKNIISNFYIIESSDRYIWSYLSSLKDLFFFYSSPRIEKGSRKMPINLTTNKSVLKKKLIWRARSILASNYTQCPRIYSTKKKTLEQTVVLKDYSNSPLFQSSCHWLSSLFCNCIW